MKELINITAQTMSSREIAELTGKNHQHVLRDIDKLNRSYSSMGLSKVGQSSYTNDQGMEMGLFEVKKTTINKPDGSILVSTTTKVTGKGQVYFVNKFLKDKTI